MKKKAIKMKKKAIIVGGGLSGSALASYLAPLDMDIEIFEKRDNPQKNTTSSSQRTIGMSLSNRGLASIERLGLKNEVINSATATMGRLSVDYLGKRVVQDYTVDGSVILTISRRKLNEQLISNAKKSQNIKFLFNHNMIHIDFEKKLCTFEYDNNIIERRYDYLFGCDGVFSRTRKILEEYTGVESQVVPLPIGYTDFSVPFKEYDDYFDKKRVSVYTSEHSEAILVALPSKALKCYLINIFCPKKWIEIMQTAKDTLFIRMFLSEKFPLLEKVFSGISNNHLAGKTSNMFEIWCNNWNYRNSVLLIGDAAHAISPFYAMGMNLALESCALFGELLKKNQNFLEKTIENFQNIRKRDTDAMRDLAFENFTNLSKSITKEYNTKWTLERRLNLLFPMLWKPEYQLVAFTELPLSAVKDLIETQRRIINEIIDENSGNIKNEFEDDNYLKEYINKIKLYKYT